MLDIVVKLFSYHRNFLLPTVTEDDDGNVSGMDKLLLVQMIVSVAALFATFIGFQSAPASPPSRAAQRSQKKGILDQNTKH
jgi:hypothetical protein